MPPLRQRWEDLPALLENLSNNLAADLGVAPIAFGEEDIARLQQYPWPGNVRELKNLVERTLLLGRLPWDALPPPSDTANDHAPVRPGFPVDWTLAQIEKEHMLRVLDASGGNKSEAARRLGVSRKTLERKLRSFANDRQTSAAE